MVTPPGGYEILTAKIDALAETIGAVRATLSHFNESLVTQARIEERQTQASESLARAFEKLSEHDQRIDQLAAAVPPLVETRRWVLGGVGLAVTAVLAAMLKVVVHDPATLRDEVHRAMAERPVATQPK